jgi:hypothetical protein
MAHVTFQDPSWGNVDIFRQTYCSAGNAGSTNYSTGKHGADYIVMSMDNGNQKGLVEQYKQSQRILVVMENPEIWTPSDEVVQKAGIVISPFVQHHRGRSAHFIRSNPGIPWFYGIEFDCEKGLSHVPLKCNLDLRDLLQMSMPVKSKVLSVILSGKANSQGYRWRSALAQKAKTVFGQDCDIFGFGHRPIPDKRVAIDPYLFTLVVENDAHNYYWTEKLADAYLGFSYPIYSGDPRVQDDFPATIQTIQFGCSIDVALKQIMRTISGWNIDYARAIEENRNHILFHHNLFYMIDRVIRRIP